MYGVHADYDNLLRRGWNMRYLSLITLLCVGLIVGCGSKSKPVDPTPKPKPPVMDTRVPYLLNGTLDLQPRLARLKEALDFDYEGLVELESPVRS